MGHLAAGRKALVYRRGDSLFPAGMGEGNTAGVVVKKRMKERYEIRRGGVTACRSGLERCGYSEKQLRGIIAVGYGYYVDGKRAKKGAQST